MSLLLTVASLVFASAEAAAADTTATDTPDIAPPALVEESVLPLPEGLLAPGEHADVRLLLDVDERGRVSRAEVVESTNALLDEHAMGAATRLRFQPATKAGAPVRVRMYFAFTFEGGQAVDSAALDEAPSPKTEIDERRAALVAGVVRRAGTSHPVIGAEVNVLTTIDATIIGSASTDAKGRFTISVEEGDYQLEVARTDFETFTAPVSPRARAHSVLSIALYPTGSDSYTTHVRARRSADDVSRVTLSRGELLAIPGTGGDPLRVIESLPGVARTPLLGGALVVRGGQPGDTAVFLDGVPIPQLTHFGALTSVVHPRFLERIDFQPSGFSARYGRAIAGVVDAHTHALDLEGFEGVVDVDMLDLGFYFAGPIRFEGLPRVDFAVAARRSIIDGVAGPFLSLASAAGAIGGSFGIPYVPVPVYDDVQAKIEVRPSGHQRFSLLFFSSSDSVQIVGDPPDLAAADDDTTPMSISEFMNLALGSKFMRLVGTHELRLTPNVRHIARPFVGTTEKGFLADGVLVPVFTGQALSAPSRSIDAGLRDELTVELSKIVAFKAGLDMLGQTMSATIGYPIAPETPCTVDAAAARRCEPGEAVGYDIEGTLTSVAAYGEVAFGPILGFSVVQGVRVEQTSATFSDDRREFAYANGRHDQSVEWLHVDPRTSARFDLDESFAFKASIGTYRRWPRLESVMLQTNEPRIDAPRAIQVVGGIEAALMESLDLDAQVYAISRDLLTRDLSRQFKGAALGPPPIAQPGDFDSLGTGQTVGLDVLLRHRPNAWFFGWVAYTLQRTWLNNGEELDPFHPAPFDTTHNIVTVGRVNLPWGFVVGGRFQFTTGAPSAVHDSLAVVHDTSTTTYTPMPSNLRRPRLPPYHRLDVRIDRAFVFDLFSVTPSLEIINAYAYPNVELTTPGGDFRSRGTVAAMPGVPPLALAGLTVSF